MRWLYLNETYLICTALTAIICLFLFPIIPSIEGREKLFSYAKNEETLKAWFQSAWLIIVENFHKVALFYFLWSALSTFQNPDTKFDALAFQLDQVSSQAFVQLFLIMVGIFYFKKSLWKKFFIGVAAFEALAIIFGSTGGLLLAPSLDSAFLASMLPIFPFPLTILSLIAIVMAKGTTAYTIIAAQLVGYAIVKHTKAWRLLTVSGILGACLWFTQGASISDSNGRIAAWKRFFTWWGDQDYHWLGTGNGTFSWIGPCIDNMHDGKCLIIEGGAFVQMHNDWLQVLFETGIVGLLLASIVFTMTTFKAKASPKLFATWLGFGAFALTYHPLRFMITGLFIAYIWREIHAILRRSGTDKKED